MKVITRIKNILSGNFSVHENEDGSISVFDPSKEVKPKQVRRAIPAGERLEYKLEIVPGRFPYVRLTPKNKESEDE